jgi:TrmH family RNA methyltransferase
MLSKLKIKYIQSLGQKKFRDEYHVFVAEGPKIVHELLTSGTAKITELYAVKDWLDKNRQYCKGILAESVTEFELEKISQLTTPQKVLAVAEKFTWNGTLSAAGKITLALDGVQDPGNLGAIVRIADWFDISQIICSRECADIYNSKVVQATMGSITRVRIEYTDLKEWLGKNKDVKIYAAVLNGRPVNKMKKIPEGVIVIGNESKGIAPEIEALCNTRITISRLGGAESLNAAVATGIILSHLTGNE